MKQSKAFILLGFLVAGSLAGAVFAEGAKKLVLAPGSRLWLEGDSTLHLYVSTATQVTAVFELAEGRFDHLIDRVRTGEVNIPVVGLKSGKSGLDKQMRKSLKSAEFPEITYRLVSHQVTLSLNGLYRVQAHGQLSVAGTWKDIDLDLDVRPADKGAMVTGTKELLMTDFGIKPPTFLGMLKTDNRVTIHFDLFLSLEDSKGKGG